LIDQFRARLGDAACSGIDVDDDHRPERAWKPTPPNMHSKGRRPQPPMAHRPPWFLATPKPVARRHLTLLRGPERIDIGWWMSVAIHDDAHRDYFVARHADGSQCWVFTDRNAEWFIHGYFS
jgi:protein ImuB